jgi:hypothetical protein
MATHLFYVNGKYRTLVGTVCPIGENIIDWDLKDIPIEVLLT